MPDFSLFKYSTHHKRPTNKQLGDFIQKHDISLKKQSKRIAEYQETLQAEAKQSLLVVFQAMDAAGKDSTIRNVFHECDPGGLEVAAFKSPSKKELAHDFMWRCYQQFPKKGQITLFNRSYYEEALVVRVHPEYLAGQGIDPERGKDNDFWQQRFDFINQTEQHLINNNTQVIKFMLDVSQKEQHDRFKSRYETEEKRWKFSIGDLKESQNWDTYQNAFDEVLKHTSTNYAPWYVIPADDKSNMRKIVAAISASHLEDMNPVFPQATAIKDIDQAMVDALLK